MPEHLKTISDRLLRGNRNEQVKGRLLGMYQQILESGQEDPPQPPLKRGGNEDPPFLRGVGGISGIPADESYEQMQLRLTGLVVKRGGRLIIYNPIYANIFDAKWIAKALKEIRPEFYGVAIESWQEAALEEKGDFFLRGQVLLDAEVWAQGKRLSDRDEEFLAASRLAERQNLEAANLVLAEAGEKAKRRVQFGSVVLAMALVLAAFAGTSAFNSGLEVNQASEKLQETKQREEISAKAKIIDQRAKEQEKLATEKQQEADRSREKAEAASVKVQEALEKQRVAELQVTSATQDVATARTVLEGVQQQSQVAQAEAQSKVRAAEALAEIAEKKGQQAAQDASKAQDAAKVARDEAIVAREAADAAQREVLVAGARVQVGNIKLSIVEARAAFLDGKKFDALLQAMKARQQLEELDKGTWSSEDIKTRVTLALQQVLYGNLQERNRFEGHSSSVRSVAFSPDGKTLATASYDNTVKLWNLEGRELQTLSGFSNSVAFSPRDGNILASANGRRVILFNLDLNDLTDRGCNWLRDYLTHNPNARNEDRQLCRIPPR